MAKHMQPCLGRRSFLCSASRSHEVSGLALEATCCHHWSLVNNSRLPFKEKQRVKRGYEFETIVRWRAVCSVSGSGDRGIGSESGGSARSEDPPSCLLAPKLALLLSSFSLRYFSCFRMTAPEP